MTIFRPDGKYGFVCSSFIPETKVVDVKTHQIVATVKQASPFSPNIAASPDGKQVWLTLKDTDKPRCFGLSRRSIYWRLWTRVQSPIT